MSNTAAAPEPAKKGGGGCFSFAAFDMFGSPVQFNIKGDESYKTVLGCFWSLVMVISLGLAMAWYLSIFLDQTNVDVTSRVLVQDEFPTINFKDKSFVFSLYGNKDKKPLAPNKFADLLNFEVIQYIYTSTTDEETGEKSEPEVEAKEIPFDKCLTSAYKVGGQSLGGKTSLALSDNAYCTDTSLEETSMYVAGNDDSDIFAFVQINVNPCDKSEKTCLFYFANTSPADINTRLNEYEVFDPSWPPAEKAKYTALPDDQTRSKDFNNFIQNRITGEYQTVYLTFNYVEAALSPENFDSPFEYTMKSTIKTYTSIASTKYINIYFREIEVQTDEGYVNESYTIQKSMGFDSAFTDFADRGFGNTKSQKKPGQTAAEEASTPIIVFNLYSSNNQLIYVRKYTKIVDVFANVGGISEIIGFVIVFCYAWYNGIRMEQSILNYGVLGMEDDGVVYDKWEKSRFFTFMDLVKFGIFAKFFSCCCKKSKKYELYQKCSDTYSERTDVVNIMRNISELHTMKEALFSAYQLKLMNYLEYGEDESKYIDPRIAVEELKSARINKSSNVIQSALDEYLWDRLPVEMKEGNFEALDVNNPDIKDPNEPRNRLLSGGGKPNLGDDMIFQDFDDSDKGNNGGIQLQGAPNIGEGLPIDNKRNRKRSTKNSENKKEI